MSDRGKTPGGDRRPPPGARKKPPPADASTPAERAMGRYVRAAYVAHRTAYESFKAGTTVRWAVPARYDGAAGRTVDPQDAGKAPGNVWYKMARWFMERRIDGVAFVQFVFCQHDPSHRVPEPLQVCNEAYLGKFQEFAGAGKEHLVCGAFQTQTRTARAAIEAALAMWGSIDKSRAVGKQWNAVQSVLLDPAKPLSPLFRYILALSSAKDAGQAGADADRERFLTIAARFYDRAVIQFQSCREAYLTHWSRWLPKNFAAEADRRYSLLAHNEETGSEDAEIERQG